jgi:hypothetical protein
MADAAVLKTAESDFRAGSNPAFGTTSRVKRMVKAPFHLGWVKPCAGSNPVPGSNLRVNSSMAEHVPFKHSVVGSTPA